MTRLRIYLLWIHLILIDHLVCVQSFIPSRFHLDPCYRWQGAYYVNGKCLWFVHTRKNWNDAVIFCKQTWMGSRLAEPRTEIERTVLRFIQEMNKNFPIWIGASNKAKEGVHLWNTDATKVPLKAEWWKSLGNKVLLDCLSWTPDGLIEEKLCEASQQFVCQHDVQIDPCYFWPDAVFVNGKCLKAFKTPSSWDIAQKTCQAGTEGGRLTEPMRISELDAARILQRGMDFDALWLGMTDITQEDRFVFASTTIEATFNPDWWDVGQPDFAAGDEDCLKLDPSGFLHDALCDSTHSFLCEKEIKSPGFVPNPCYFWEESVYANGKCIKLFSEKQDWLSAQERCAEDVLGGTLVELMSDRDLNAVMPLWINSTKSYWVGANDLETESRFVWSSTQTEVGIWLWVKNDDNIVGEHCLFLHRWGKLHDTHCEAKLHFICQRAVDNPCEAITGPLSEYFQGSCFILDERKDFKSKVQQNCVDDYNGFLVEPSTVELDMAVSNFAYSVFGEGLVAIGGKKNSHMWSWPVSGDFITNSEWRKMPSTLYEDKLALNSLTGEWTEDSNPLPFICQIDIGNPCDEELPGGVYTAGLCFKFFNVTLTSDEAQEFCIEKDAHLAEPKTQHLSSALNEYLKYRTDPTPTPSTWIGATFDSGHNAFKWTTTGQDVGYNEFPSSPTLGMEKPKVFIQHNQWFQESSTAKLALVCQLNPRSRNHNQYRYYIVLPTLTAFQGDQTAVLQITTSSSSHRVYLQIRQVIGIDKIPVINTYVSPTMATSVSLDKRLVMNSNGVNNKYASVVAMESVSVFLYILGENHTSSASMFVLPKPFQTSQMARSHFLVSGSLTGTTANIMAASPFQKNGITPVSLTFPDQETMVSVNSISYSSRGQMEAETKLGFTHYTMYIQNKANLDGAYLRANESIYAIIGSSASENSDSAIEQSLPIEYLDSWYMTFPSVPSVGRHDTYKLMAVSENTVISIHPNSGPCPTNYTLDFPGDVLEVELPRSFFQYISGNKRFYAYKLTHSEGSLGLSKAGTCLTSLLPINLWRHRYELEVTSFLHANKAVYVALIVPQDMTSLINTGYNDVVKPICHHITGTQWAGCHCQLPRILGRYYRFHLRDYRHRFGAYVHTVSSDGMSLMCHPLGMRLMVQQGESFDHNAYMNLLTKQTTTPSVCASTTSGSTRSQASTTTISSTTDATTINLDTWAPVNGVTASQFSNISGGMWGNSDYMRGIQKYLEVNRRFTFAYKRRKMSAADDRISSRTIGVTGITCVALVLSVIVYNDIMNAVMYISCPCRRCAR